MEGSRPTLSESIFGGDPQPPRRIYSVPRSGSALVARTVSATAQRSHDAALIAILDAPLHPGETAHAGFLRKEVELGETLATLTVLESRALHARLSNRKTGDTLAEKFSRLTIERRTRLIGFLATARRRAANPSRGEG